MEWEGISKEVGLELRGWMSSYIEVLSREKREDP